MHYCKHISWRHHLVFHSDVSCFMLHLSYEKRQWCDVSLYEKSVTTIIIRVSACRRAPDHYSPSCSSPVLASFKSILLHLCPSHESACCLPCKREIIFGWGGGGGVYSQGRALPWGGAYYNSKSGLIRERLSRAGLRAGLGQRGGINRLSSHR